MVVCIERGGFLALDLGGTNFRVLLITVRDNEDADIQNTIYAISNELMTGPGEQVLAIGIYHTCKNVFTSFYARQQELL